MSLAPLRTAKNAGKRARTLDSLLVATQNLLLTRTAATLSIADIVAEARMVQGTFYNYFDDLNALLDEVGALLLARIAQGLHASATASTTPAETFAAKTRQALRIFSQSPGVGRMLFDIGLPVDRFLRQLHHDIRTDIADGMKSGDFKTGNADLLVSVVCGGITGLALDLHRRRLPASAIDPATQELLRLVGVPPAKAKRLSSVPVRHTAPIHLPLTWHAPVVRTHPRRGKNP